MEAILREGLQTVFPVPPGQDMPNRFLTLLQRLDGEPKPPTPHR
jgi:hypothetical protein